MDTTSELNVVLAELGREVRAERVRRGLSRAQLAEQTGVSTSQIGKIERGDRGQLHEALRVANALGFSLGEAINRAEERAELHIVESS